MSDPIAFPAIDFTVIIQSVIVFGWAIVLLVIDLFIPRDRKRLTGYLALLGIVAAAVAPLVGDLAGIPFWNTNGVTFTNMIAQDNYALVLNWIFLLSAAITVVISLDYLPRQGIERGEYYVLLLIATGGMMLLAQGTDLIVLFLGLELLSITLYLLVGFAYPRLSSEEAAMKYLLIGAFAAGFLVFGIALIYGATGTSNLFDISKALAAGLAAEDLALLLAGSALVIVGFGYKISMAPFHMWTPDVYEGAPTPVTAFMSAATKTVALVVALRVLVTAFPHDADLWTVAIAVIAVFSLVVGNFAALVQKTVKRMLAYSSISHAGFMLIAVAANSALGE